MYSHKPKVKGSNPSHEKKILVTYIDRLISYISDIVAFNPFFKFNLPPKNFLYFPKEYYKK